VNQSGAPSRGVRALRVCAVDPGLTRCGIAVVDIETNRKAKLVDVIVVGSPGTEPIGERLSIIDTTMDDLLGRYRPDHLAVERMFAQNNTPTIMGTAQASGVAIAAGARRKIPAALLTPSEVKAAVTGSGSADKKQVTAMVTRILGLAAPPKPADAADAIAIAIAHAWRGGLFGRGLDTGKLTSPSQRSKFSAAGPPENLTPAQKLWLAAERRTK